MRALSVLLIASLTWGCALSKTGKVLDGAAGSLKVADQITTDRAEARGAREGNLILGSEQWRQIAVGALGFGAVVLVARTVEKQRPILSHVIRLTAITVWGLASLHNAGVYR